MSPLAAMEAGSAAFSSWVALERCHDRTSTNKFSSYYIFDICYGSLEVHFKVQVLYTVFKDTILFC